MKCKGIRNKELKEKDFISHGRASEFDGLKKKTSKLTKDDREKGITLFSVCNTMQTRTFMKNSWTNMIFKDNQYYPFGYESGSESE